MYRILLLVSFTYACSSPGTTADILATHTRTAADVPSRSTTDTVDLDNSDSATQNDASEPAPAFQPPSGKPPGLLGGTERPSLYYVPEQYTHDTSWPLLILLHGYSASGLAQDGYTAMSTKVSSRGFILITPDGTPDADGYLHWNATDACCDFGGIGTNDVAYISSLIDEASTWFNVDADRVLVMGHSNGGYMTFRLACDIGDRLAGAISIAGGMWLDDTKCPAPAPLTMIAAHAPDDIDVNYEGSTSGSQQYKGAIDSAAFWAKRNGCADVPQPQGNLDLVTEVVGNETERIIFPNCSSGTQVEVWRMNDAGHSPDFSDGVFAEYALDVLLAARRP